jgi:MFS superfamily sulfate permease-like transporter
MLKDRLRRVEMFGALSVHPGEDQIDRPFRTVVLDCERMTNIDARYVRGGQRGRVVAKRGPRPLMCRVATGSALHVLLEVVRGYKARQIAPYFVRVSSLCLRGFEQAGIVDELGADHLFDSVHDALAHGGHLRPVVAPAATLL